MKNYSRHLIRLISAAALLAALIICIGFVQRYLCIPNTTDDYRIIRFHKEPANTIDVLFIGSSSTYTGFSSAHAYDRFGFTSYPYALAGSSCVMWKPALQDAMRTQKPKLVVLDVFGGGYAPELLGTRNGPLYIISNHSPLSLTKIKTAVEVSKVTEETSTFSLLFPFFKYHRKVMYDLSKIPENIRKKQSVLEAGPSPLKGIETLTETKKSGKLDESSFTSDTMDLDPKTEAVVRDFLQYCKDQNIEVLLVKFPTVLTEKREEKKQVNLRANRVLEIGREYGFDSLNMQPLFYEMGLDPKVDYYNHDHTNVRGQKKVTEYLGNYIRNNLGIGPSELDEDVKKAWDDSVIYYDELTEVAEECIADGTSRVLADTPPVVDEMKKRISQ